ncbi:hypothetical protein [uncultured Thiothrix sp.]|uniref:DUF7079 family protein n=1 Tax=uncultured Thiothrix sp. TaxID=223185 RepID=UPI002630BC82|nr:hypothetical protein [uncultured Thiothrix sp.]
MNKHLELASIIETRRPVWFAMSQLFLQSEYKDDVETVAKTLAESPYSLPELEAILRYEVTPVLKADLSIFAWPGDAYDKDALELQLTRRINQKPWFKFGLPKSIRHDWQTLQQLIEAERQINITPKIE